MPFTAADFWACDARLVTHLALAADDGSDGKVVPFAEHVASNPGAWAGELPYLLMISRDERLHRVLVDRPLIHLTRRSVEQWHRLQELAGIHNSYVALERRPAAGTARGGAGRSRAAAPAAVAPATRGTRCRGQRRGPRRRARGPRPLPAVDRDRALRDLQRVHRDQRPDVRYNDDRQAYIADPDAGTYAELVLAAESCQVAIIHPGKPRNPAEPGLDDLVKRAEAFA